MVIDGEFTVLKGSLVNPTMSDFENVKADSTKGQYLSRELQRQTLIADGVIVIDQSNVAKFSRDWRFSSPSAAGAVALGWATCNGPRMWQVGESGKTYREWENGDDIQAPKGT
jgi:hypothetical protein